ncbi:MAG: stage II sporulation protein R [Clostridia bacterium]|nr:stage II sporulation protein R [Clostridia bacterium]
MLLPIAALIFTTVTVLHAREVYDGVLRLHILADSDSEKEQQLKLQVRDAILSRYSQTLAACESDREAEAFLEKELDAIRLLAQETVSREGACHTVDVSLTREYYPTRQYDGFTLPAGEYTSLRILIGSGEGKNWFCMVYPPICTASCEAEDAFVEAGFSKSQIRFLTEGEEGYTVRFKIVEGAMSLWHKVKGWFSS